MLLTAAAAAYLTLGRALKEIVFSPLGTEGVLIGIGLAVLAPAAWIAVAAFRWLAFRFSRIPDDEVRENSPDWRPPAPT